MTFHDTNIVADSANPFGWLQRAEPKRYDDFGTLHSVLEERSAAAKTETIKNRDIQLLTPEIRVKDDANQLTMTMGDREIGLTHWSFGQLAQLAKAPPSFLRTLPTPLVKEVLDYALRFNREIEDVKTYFDGSELRAITGPAYGRVDDHEVVRAAQTILDDGRWNSCRRAHGIFGNGSVHAAFLDRQAEPGRGRQDPQRRR